MGVQIHIEVVDLLKAGWTLSVDIEEHVGYDWVTDEEVIDTFHLLRIEKDGWSFQSYYDDCFIADINNWGSNKQRFINAGLLVIPHTIS